MNDAGGRIVSRASACDAVRGKPSRMNPPAGIGRRQPIAHQIGDQIVADQTAGRHDAGDLMPER